MLRVVRAVVSFGLCVLALNACGGGGSAPSQPPPPNPLYVRTSGNDTNSGKDPANALRSISKAAQIALSNYKIIVGAGTYTESITTASTGQAPEGLQFIADVTGAQTGDRSGPVVINASGTQAAGFKLFHSAGSLIDGFTIVGAADAGIVLKTHSDDFTIQNCTISGGSGDGIRVQDSASVVIFNNLVYNNVGMGVGIVAATSGSPNAIVVNNTIFSNGDRGITVGNAAIASTGAFIRNNIVEGNGIGSVPTLENIKVFTPPPNTVPRSDVGYSEDFNLVLPATYLPASLAGKHDLHQDATFKNAGSGDFHLVANSPAVDAGDSLNNLSTLANFLRGRTTTGGTSCDQGALDLGFHYAPSGRCTAVGP